MAKGNTASKARAHAARNAACRKRRSGGTHVADVEMTEARLQVLLAMNFLSESDLEILDWRVRKAKIRAAIERYWDSIRVQDLPLQCPRCGAVMHPATDFSNGLT